MGIAIAAALASTVWIAWPSIDWHAASIDGDALAVTAIAITTAIVTALVYRRTIIQLIEIEELE